MMDWKDIAAAVGKIAPILGPLLGGPIGTAATVGGMIASALGTEGTADAVSEAIVADPEAALKLREIESNNRVRLEELAVQRVANELLAESEAIKTAAADRDSARKANVAGGIAPQVFWLVIVIFMSVIFIEAAVLLRGLPEGVDGQMAGRVLGTLDAALLAALYYVFGSSAGSARKDATIQAQAVAK